MDGPYTLKVCCMGAGYVGGPTMAVISKFCPSIRVTVVDVAEKQIARWNSANFDLPIYEPGLEALVRATRGRNLFFSTDIDRHIKEADVIFVCVNTPTKVAGIGAGAAADTKNIELCARMIAEYAMSDKIVVEKSTVPVHTAEVLMAVFNANSKSSVHFEVLSNPEFLSEGTAVEDLISPSRVLIGGGGTPAGQAAVRTLDLLNLVYLAESFHLPEVAAYWRSVVTMNEYQKHRFGTLIVRTLFNTVTQKKIGIFGFAYKKDTGDTRETAAAAIMKVLVAERAQVFVYDPKVELDDLVNELKYQGLAGDEIQNHVHVVHDAYAAVDKAHALAVLTEWEEFKTYDYTRIYDTMLKPAFIFDGRNLLPHDHLRRLGFSVHGIGKKE
ncbi:hypothetical protein DYB32_005164 [Aphanomyces invadans]|uniref:UDP-glucose 6-dehydrogenase n=1 Tax=Aphanomyces invadans TaxID=157072 RepID=A0A3R6YYK3_9STRA|nr:hypothetical protein DYB32_005164 [Aphanomyces invadans]